jgi:O-acetyl-ADP-ribose deacetylase
VSAAVWHRIEFVLGDLLAQEVDAIVNPANERLSHGAGVAAQIAEAAGEDFAEECAAIGGCATGSAVVTGAGLLPQDHVIHAVGPVWSGGGRGEDEILAACHLAVVRAAAHLGARAIALPAISTGVFGYPPERAAPVAVAATARALPGAPALERVVFCFIDPFLHGLYRAAARDAGLAG